MNKMRFGAILVASNQRVGFYLSHRVLLTVPLPGEVRAVSYNEFGNCKVFARNGVAVSFFEAMLNAASTTEKFNDSIEMISKFLILPEKSDFEDLCKYMSSGDSIGFVLCNYKGADLLKLKDNIRNKYGVDEMRNAIHSSDSGLNVYRESKIYFATPTI